MKSFNLPSIDISILIAKRNAAVCRRQRAGVINSRAILGGLHHHYARI
jgi:hypothetical protein